MLIATSLLAFVNAAHAGQITNLQVYDGGGAPTATINYSGANGTGSYSAYVYADPQVSYGTSVPLFYCVDLWHDNYIGSTYTINPVSTMAFSNSTFSDVDNRIDEATKRLGISRRRPPGREFPPAPAPLAPDPVRPKPRSGGAAAPVEVTVEAPAEAVARRTASRGRHR